MPAHRLTPCSVTAARRYARAWRDTWQEASATTRVWMISLLIIVPCAVTFMFVLHGVAFKAFAALTAFNALIDLLHIAHVRIEEDRAAEQLEREFGRRLLPDVHPVEGYESAVLCRQGFTHLFRYTSEGWIETSGEQEEHGCPGSTVDRPDAPVPSST